jgi:hypothetical protein
MFHSWIKDYPARYPKMAINLVPLILYEEYFNTISWGLILKMVLLTMSYFTAIVY